MDISTSLNAGTGLTQALSDGTYTYFIPVAIAEWDTYGLGRIAQYDTTAEYFLGDALGSVRQLTDANGNLTLSKAYDPYGTVAQSAGAGQTSYGYTDEYQDSYNELVYLRARHYAPSMGRFLSRDTWAGDYNRPGSLNRWMYTEGNVVNLTDPTGHDPMRLFSRDASRDYAMQYKDSVNHIYGEFGDSDCTNFVSQVLKAGGLPEDSQWLFEERAISPRYCSGNRIKSESILFAAGCGCADGLATGWKKINGLTVSSCGRAWAVANEFYNYLTSTLSFATTKFPLPYHLLSKDDTWRSKIIDDPRITQINVGDVVFYDPEDGERFTHVAVVVGFGPPTLEGQPDSIYTGYKVIPYMVDHSGPNFPKPRAIDDTWKPLDELTVVHIPSRIARPQNTSPSWCNHVQ